MRHEILKYLYDIRESIDSITDFLGEKRDFNDYKSNKSISEARRIVDLRNWVIHGYDRVDDVIIWGILSRDIPRLEYQGKKLIDK